MRTCKVARAPPPIRAPKQALARKGKRGWVSDDAKWAFRNLKGNVSTLEQNSWDTSRVFWLPVLARGKLHVEALPEGFPGDTAEGAVTLVEKLPGILAKRFPNESQPKVVTFNERGSSRSGPHRHFLTILASAAGWRSCDCPRDASYRHSWESGVASRQRLAGRSRPTCVCPPQETFLRRDERFSQDRHRGSLSKLKVMGGVAGESDVKLS